MTRFAYILGAQKAATTSLAYLLDQHPQIAVSSIKEPHFYSTAWDQGRDWYEGLFPRDFEGVRLDASTSYAMVHSDQNGVPTSRQPEGLVKARERIHAATPDARFVYIVRDPVERVYSAYWHRVRAGREKRPFLETVVDNHRYLSPSRYGTQIARYLEVFPKEHFLFLVFEEITGDMASAAKKCAAHFGVGPFDFTVEESSVKNASYQFSGLGRVARQAFGSEARFKSAKQFADKILPRQSIQMIKRLMTNDVPPLDDEARRVLSGVFEEECARFKSLTGVNVAIRQ